MDNYSRNELAEQSPNNNGAIIGSDELKELRCLLLGVEPTKIEYIYQRLDDLNITPEELSKLLPEAIMLRSNQDKLLGEAVVTTVEHAIQASVQKDINILSNAFFPIIGPSIRQAIAAALEGMVQSLNQTLEHSLSPESFKWRLEAKRTGKSFAEIVLLRTLIYRVEQVFLIHKDTGLMLHHIVAPQVAAQDPDLISAMLTAIQDFVRDSFGGRKDDALHKVQFGELTIWVEQGPQAVLAGIIRGNAPVELRSVFQEAIEKIHLVLGLELHNFTGETEPFESSKPYLEACLSFRYKTSEQKNNYTYAWIALGSMGLAIAIWSFFTIREQLRWNDLVRSLDSQPGIVVSKAEKRFGKYYISGLRDPLAVDPKEVMKKSGFNPENAIATWEPYFSLDRETIGKRAAQLLQAPSTVSFQVDSNQILHVSGSAPRSWILEARRSWRFIPGITGYEDNKLAEAELGKLNYYKNQIEQEVILFEQGKTTLKPNEEKKLPQIVLNIQKLLSAAQYLGKDARIKIVGHTNTIGSEDSNMKLSQERAATILQYLTSKNIPADKFTAVGVSSSQPMRLELTDADREINRRVSFQAQITGIPN